MELLWGSCNQLVCQLGPPLAPASLALEKKGFYWPFILSSSAANDLKFRNLWNWELLNCWLNRYQSHMMIRFIQNIGTQDPYSFYIYIYKVCIYIYIHFIYHEYFKTSLSCDFCVHFAQLIIYNCDCSHLNDRKVATRGQYLGTYGRWSGWFILWDVF